MSDRRNHAAAVAMIGASVASLQFGAALAATAFPLVGPVGVVALRLITSAVVLVGAGGLRIPGSGRPGRSAWYAPLSMGVVLAGMNTSVYAAIARLPLGVVITLEYLGPLAVALLHSRRRSDVVLAVTALGGVTLLTGGLGGADDLLGVGLTLVAASGWALYILLAREFGRRDADGGLALASVVAAAIVAPAAVTGAARTGWAGWTPRVVLIGVAVGVLSSAVPYTLDRLALRRIEPGPFGVLMSLHPAVAALAGLILLGQRLSPRQILGMAVIVVVSAISARSPHPVRGGGG